MSGSRPARIKVWDRVVRGCHWALAAAILLSWLTRHAAGSWHEWLGYTALAVVGLRALWGFGPVPHARFSSLAASPVATWRYAADVLRGRATRSLGLNPLGGWMALTLLTNVVLVGFTGWLYTTDRFWGIEWVETLHLTLANVLFALIFIHVSAVVYVSVRQRENLIAAMLHGYKRAESRDAPRR